MSNENRTIYLVDFNPIKVDIENGAILQFSFGKALPKKLAVTIHPAPSTSQPSTTSAVINVAPDKSST